MTVTFPSSAEDTTAGPPYIGGPAGDTTDSGADTSWAAATTAESAETTPDDNSSASAMTGDTVHRGDREPESTPADEYDRIIHVPPTSLTIGPNMREDNAEPTRDEVKDYQAHGVEDAIKAYRDTEGTLVVLKGQRRVRTAVKAQLAEVPVWVQPPPSEDEKAATIDRITKQYRWTRHRKEHTRRDAFRAVEQLKLFGLSVAAIAKRLSLPKREVADSLKVGVSELAAAAADRYELTLDQAAEIAECERLGDLVAAKELIRTAAEGPHNFKTLAERLRRDRAAAEKLRKSLAACTNQLTAAGITILDESIADSDWTGQARSLDRLRPSPDHEPGTTLTLDNHATCPGHSAWIRHVRDDAGDKIATLAYACADFREYGHALIDVRAGWVDHNTRVTDTNEKGDGFASDGVTGDDGNGGGMSGVSGLSVSGAMISADVTSEAVDPEAEAAAAYAAHVAAELERRKAEIESAWVEDNTKNAEAARTVRQDWLSAFVHRKSIPKGARKWLALRTLAGAYALWEVMDAGHPLAHRLLGLPKPQQADNDWTAESAYERSELYERIDTASDAKAAVYEMFLVLCAFEQAFRTDSWRTPTEVDQLHIRMAIDLGYEAPDIDRNVLNPDNLEDIIAAALATGSDENAEDAEAGDIGAVGAVEDLDTEEGAEPHIVESTAASDQPVGLAA
jgi:ParB family chromosome partitioning protein